ncbi:MAG: GNAT family N-acetyltransferase [Acidimicrobiaceae bacterium]|nr:GNAT family N-acetyltransferase [Acidimicrobiaceae bacterium]
MALPIRPGIYASRDAAFVASQVEHWDTLGFGLWTVFKRGSPVALGYLGLSVPTFCPEVSPAVEVGWRLDPEVWGKGYATEGARAALQAAFDVLHLEHVISLPQTENPPSIRVAEKIGMPVRELRSLPQPPSGAPSM